MDGSEKAGAVAALLNQRFPEGFAIGQAGNGGEFVEGVAVAGQFGGIFIFRVAVAFIVCGIFIAVVRRCFLIKTVRQRQVKELQGDTRSDGVADGLPFGREGGEGVVNRLLRRVRAVGEQGDGRAHRGVGG